MSNITYILTSLKNDLISGDDFKSNLWVWEDKFEKIRVSVILLVFYLVGTYS